RFTAFSPRKVITGGQSLAGLSSLVLADDPLPGYTGPIGGEAPNPTGPPTQNKQFSSTVSVPGGGSRAPGTYETYEFTIGPNDGNGAMTVKIEWDTSVDDFDLYVYSKDSSGNLTEVNHSAGGSPQKSEKGTITNPAAGDYVVLVDNYAAPDPRWRGSVTFAAPAPGSVATGSGAYTPAEKDAWFARLRQWVQDGGNLVLTDGALRALPELVPAIPAGSVSRKPVYAGQIAFADADENDPTLDDALAANVAQDGARFGSGMRRQMFEPTPPGFAIQDPEPGDDQPHSRPYD